MFSSRLASGSEEEVFSDLDTEDDGARLARDAAGGG